MVHARVIVVFIAMLFGMSKYVSGFYRGFERRLESRTFPTFVIGCRLVLTDIRVFDFVSIIW